MGRSHGSRVLSSAKLRQGKRKLLGFSASQFWYTNSLEFSSISQKSTKAAAYAGSTPSGICGGRASFSPFAARSAISVFCLWKKVETVSFSQGSGDRE